MSGSPYKEDSFYIALAILCWAATLPMLVAGIWSDGRWFAMAALMVVLGFIFGFISVGMDKLYAERRVQK